MPYISVECGPLREGQHEELITRLTETAAETMGVPAEFFTVTIKELPDRNFGIGGRTIDQLKAAWQAAHDGEPPR